MFYGSGAMLFVRPFRRLVVLLLFLGASLPAMAQIDVGLRMVRRQFVVGEPVRVVITITNHAGRDLVFQSDGRLSWLDFMVKNDRGQPISAPGATQFRAVRVPVGQSLSREVDLSKIFTLSKIGTYSVYATVRFPGNPENGFMSNRALFTVTKGREIWSQKVGVKGKVNQTREYKVLTFSDTRKSYLYVQVVDNTTGQPIRTFSLGEALLFRKPEATVDRDQNLQVLFLATPSVWTHIVVNANGQAISRNFYKRGTASDPRLVTFGTGEVVVAGGAPYDPVAERQARAREHKISDRPNIVYD
jgi:hypothetical protein